jgi:hypothetical protein
MSAGIDRISSGTAVVNSVTRWITRFIDRFLTLETFLIIAFLLGLALFLFIVWKEDVEKKKNFMQKYREI